MSSAGRLEGARCLEISLGKSPRPALPFGQCYCTSTSTCSGFRLSTPDRSFCTALQPLGRFVFHFGPLCTEDFLRSDASFWNHWTSPFGFRPNLLASPSSSVFLCLSFAVSRRSCLTHFALCHPAEASFDYALAEAVITVWGRREESVALGPPPILFAAALFSQARDQLSASFSGTERAPKMQIGGSGLHAAPILCATHGAGLDIALAKDFDLADASAALLFALGDYLSSFFFTLFSMAFLALWCTLLRPLPGRSSPLGRLLVLPASGVPSHLVSSFAVASPARPVLRWQPAQRARVKHRPGHALEPSRLMWLLVLLLGFGSCPQQVWAAPVLPAVSSSVPAYFHDMPHAPTPDSLHTQVRSDHAFWRRTGFQYLSPPLPGARPSPASVERALAITIYAPHFMPTYFGLQVPVGASLEDVMEAVIGLGKVPGPEQNVLLPVCRQRFHGSLDLLAFPASIHEIMPPHSAVLLDLSRVGGHYHAACLPTHCTRQDLLDHIARIIWYETTEVEIWVDDSEMPAQHGGLAFTSGSLLTVALRNLGPFRTCTPRQVIGSGEAWGPLEHAIFPHKPVGEAAMDSYASFYMSASLLSPFSSHDSVRRVLRLAPHARLLGTDTHLRLDLHGDHCHTVLSGPAEDKPWLLDFRRIGFAPAICFGESQPVAQEVAKHLPGQFPACLKLVCTCQTPAFKRELHLPVVQVSLVPAAGSVPATSLRGLSLSTPSLRAAVATARALEEEEHLPEPLQRIGDTPLIVVGPEDDDVPADSGTEDEAASWHPTFVVHALDTSPSHYRVALEAPCSVERALQELAGVIPIERYRYFPRLLAVEPQPSQFWAAVLALPPWSHSEHLVLLNLIALDNRCFAAPLPSPFTRAQVLAAARLEPDHPCDVFAFNQFVPMNRAQECDVIEAGMITLRPPEGPFVVQGPSLRNMLVSPFGWDMDPVLPRPAVAERVCVVLDTTTHMLELEDHTDQLQTAIASHFGCANSPTHFAISNPEVQDVQCFGLDCARLCAFMPADATTAQLEEPPCLVILDCRPLLQGLTIWMAHQPRIMHSDITVWAETFAPDGWQVQIEGADIEAGLLIVHDGCVLTLEFVPVTSSESGSAIAGGTTSDCTDSGSSSSSSPAPRGQPPSPAPRHSDGGRSRSPRGPEQREGGARESSRALRVLTGRVDPLSVGSGLFLCQLLPVAGCDPAIAGDQDLERRWSAYLGRLAVFECLGHGALLIASQLLVFSAYKLLQELLAPAGPANARLAGLLETNQRLQFPWLFEQDSQDPDDLDLYQDGQEDDGQEAGATVEVTFAVLIPDYAAEYVHLPLLTPITEWEAIAVLVSARSTAQHLRFPHVVPVRPQVRPGIAVCVAAPRWHQYAVIVCIDAGELDGRVFAEYGPHYADRDHLLWLANLPLNTECDVLVGEDEEPLLPDTLVHLVAGVLIQYLPRRTVSRPRFPLHRHFRAPMAALAARQTLPCPATRQAYCLALSDAHRLMLGGFEHPLHFREQVARAAGLAEAHLHTLPAFPAVTDVALHGVSCRGVVGVFNERPADTPMLSLLLDCRPVQGGFRLYRVPAATFTLERLRELLQTDAPWGWYVRLTAYADSQEASPAQQALAWLVDYSPVDAPETETPGSASHPSSGGTAHPAPQPSHTAALGPPGPGQPAVEESPATDTISPWTTAMAEMCIPYTVLAVDYAPEHGAIFASFPVSLDTVAVSVMQARQQSSRDPFPCLIPTDPQPDLDRAYFIAVPRWTITGFCVFFDTRAVDGRLFAVNLPAFTDRQGLLRVAQLEGTPFLHVFFREMPWPLQDDQRVYLSMGDLVCICPVDHDITVLATLEERLLDPSSWPTREPDRPALDPSMWVMTTESYHRIPLTTPRGSNMRRAVADALRLDPLTLRISTAVPGISDFSFRGWRTDSILVAVSNEDRTWGAPPSNCTYIIDKRALMLGITWGTAWGGVVDLRVHFDSLEGWCPAGYVINIQGGRALQWPRRYLRQVRDGAVLVVVISPAAPRSGSALPTDGHLPPDEDNTDDRSGPDQPHSPRNGGPADDGGTGGTLGAALPSDTANVQGGTRQLLHSSSAVLAGLGPWPLHWMQALLSGFEQSDTWVKGLIWIAVQAGALVLTPVFAALLLLLRGFVATGLLLSASCGGLVRWTNRPWTLRLTIGFLCVRSMTASPSLLEVTHSDPPTSVPQAQSLWPSPEPSCVVLPASHFTGRSIPTPCRAPLRIPVMGAGIEPEMSEAFADLSTLVTLLDEAVARPDSEAFMLASTLLDVLQEHLPVPPPAASDCTESLPEQPQILCLESGLPLTEHQRNALALAGLVPAAANLYATDWLDNDISFLLHDRLVLTCELLGVAWGLIWIIEYAPRLGLPVCQLYDCTAAGQGTFATARLAGCGHDSTSRLALFATHLRQLAHQRVQLDHAHVKGHAGQVCNELCDELAKHRRRNARSLDQELLPTWPAQVYEHPQQGWIWLAGLACQDLPTLFAFESEANRLQSHPRLPSEDPALGFVPEPQTSTPVPLQFALMSYNVLTLYDPKRAGQPPLGVGMRVSAKRDIIKRQLQEHRVLLLGLQETRIVGTEMPPDKDFFMLQASAEPNGHHGVALWISKCLPYAAVQGTDMVFRKEHCCVVGFSSRHLVVQLTAPHLSWTVLVAHAPSEPPAPPGASRAFWAQCKKDLERRPRGSDIIVLADANAWLGSLVSPSVSDLDSEPENCSGEQFHHFLADMDLWVPSTFRSNHSGPSATWTAPTGHEHRLDYIAVPLGWPSDAVVSSVLVDFESLQVGQDHKPVLMRVGLIATARTAKGKGTYKRQAVRPAADAHSPEYLAALAMLPSSPGLTWDTCVDRHYAALVESWNRAGQDLQSPATAKPQQAYIQPHTMSMVHARRGLREFLSSENGELRRRRLLLGLAAFLHLRRRTSFSEEAVARYAEWISTSHRRIASALRMVRLVGFHLRQAVRADRAAYLEGLVQNITLSDIRDPKHLYRSVRKAFPSAASKRRQAFTPLPAVADAQGVLAPDVASQRELWRAHFASLEAGEKLEPGQYAAAFRDQRIANIGQQPCFDFQIVPSLTTVEQSILSLKRGKACGQDGITAELLRHHTALSARALLPVFVKSILGAQEPVEYRGGALMPLAKKASAAFSCAKFRAILLSCVPSKMLHKHVRTCLSAHLSPCDLQAGVLPGVSTESIALAARTFQSFCHSTAQPWALLFFDVRSAFYRVIRQLLLPVGDSDQALLHLFSRLHLPPASIEELRDQLARLATVTQTSCSDHLRRVATDVLQGTWFRLDQDTALTLTHCGTRPGDGLADMFFGFAFGAYLKAADQALQERGLDTRMPEPKQSEPWPLESLPHTLGAGSWADDFVHLHAQRQPRGLGRAIQQIVSVYVTQAEAIGMELTFAADKTAAMVAPKDKVRDCDWAGTTDEDGPFLWVRGHLSGTDYRLPVVHVYCHLGGVVTETLTPAPEVGLRYSLAANTVRSLGRKLFGSRHVPLRTRRCLLRSLVLSKFVFGSAVIRFGSAIHFRNWAKYYVALWRALHPWVATNKQPHAYQVLRTAEAPSPPLALALARSVLLRQIVAKGPSTLVRLLWVQWEHDPVGSWFGALVQDVRHAAQYVPVARLLLSTNCPLRALLEAVRDDGMWWTRQLKKAAKVFQDDLEAWATAGRSPVTDEQDDIAASPPRAPCFCCSLCPAAFPLRKHLAVHEARKHGLISVTRLLSPGPTCLACMKHYDSIERVQHHLKNSHTCLHRVARLIPPLSPDGVKEAERDCKRLKRQVVRGKWELYKAPEQVQIAAGPRLLTAHERVAAEGEDISLLTLAGLFHPCPDFLRRVDTYIADRSQEGPRRTSACFWDRRPR